MRKKETLESILVVVAFLIALYGDKILNTFISIYFPTTFFKISFIYLWWSLPTLLVLGVLYGFKNIFENLGLNKGFVTGLFFSIVVVSPMLISSAIIGKIDDELDLGSLLHKTFVAGFFEEYLFRGFLFGILFAKLRWGFIPASILGGLLFGMGHIYQGSSMVEILGVFSITAIGAIWFSWLYVEWDKNLWVPIFLHSFMNLSWTLFDVSENAMGGFYVNVFRTLTIACAIIATIRYHKKRGLHIRKKNLIVHNHH